MRLREYLAESIIEDRARSRLPDGLRESFVLNLIIRDKRDRMYGHVIFI